jgi:DnaJ family protein C protein 9
MRHIPHSTFADEPRFIVIVDALVDSGALAETPTWKTTSKDEKARRVREKAAGKEAREAEQLAKELGVWDEFYGSGAPGARRGRGKGQGAADDAKPRSKGASPAKGKGKGKQPAAAADDDDDDADVGALQALILRRKSQREEKLGGFFDSLAAKYAEPAPGAKKGKRRRRAADDEDDDDADANAGGAADGPPKKRARTKGGAAAPEISDAEFEALQAKLFGDKAKPAAPAVEKEKKNAKGRKAK